MKTFTFLLQISLDRLRAASVIIVMLMLSASLKAQNVSLSGTITDATDNSPLIGATIRVKGTNSGTVSNIDGEFNINANYGDILVCSYIGYLTEEIEITNEVNNIRISLAPDLTSIDEVVVVGFGTQKRINVSGAADQLDSKEIASRPISSISQGLQGAVPNLNIDYYGGEPGAAAKINIRGLASINEGEPLILIDGVPSDALELNRLAPEDVDNISVLKDAASAAIYGARAAFGVILITTKKGENKGISINYSSNYSWDKPTVLPNKITDPYIYLRLLETSTDNTPWDNQNFSDETYQWAKERSDNPGGTVGVRVNPNDETTWEYMGNRDWTYYFLDDYNSSQKQHLSINGATDNTAYYVSAGYDRQNGALKIADDLFDRYSLRSKVNYKPYKWLSIGNNTFITSTQREKPSYLDMWTIYNLFPTDWDINPDGSWANTTVGETAAQLTDGGKTNEDYNSIQSTFTGEVSILKDVLKLNADFTFRKGLTDYDKYYTKYKIGYGPDDIRETGSNEASRSSTNENYTVFNIYTTFRKNFGQNHELTAIVGFNQEEYRYEWFNAEKDDVISSSLPTIGLATGTANVDEVVKEWAIRGAFYRLNYILLNKYIVEFNGRYDGTSKFPESKRFGFFPSASAAWKMHEENFMSGISFISNLKLRGSYGSLGNQLVSEYGYIASMESDQANYIIGDQLPQKVTPPSLVSPNYTWEEVETVNFGIDLGLIENRIYSTFDIYTRDTKGMLTQGTDLPDVLGADEPNENAADLRTKGWELTVGYKNNFNLAGKSLYFDTRFILSDSRSEITKFDNPNKNLTQYYEGMELGEIWGLESDGLFQNQSEIDALDESSIIPWGALSIVPGWPKYIDQDGNDAIETGTTVDDPKDLKVIGNFSPRYRFGFNLNLNWGGFDFRAFLQGVAKRDYYPLDYLYWGFYQQPYAGGYEHLNDFYRGEADSDVDRAKHAQAYINAGLADANTDAKYPILQSWLADRNLGERIDQAKGLAIPQTRYLLNAGYIRLKNITVGYTLPSSLTDRLNIGSVRVFVSGENLNEWSEVKDYFDPEAINDVNYKYDPSANPAERQDGKGYAYPYQRRYSFGINVNF